MNYFKSFLMRYWYYFIIGVLLLMLIGVSTLLYFSYEDNADVGTVALVNEDIEVAKEEEEVTKLCSIDIKGAVKKPGVYEIECHKNINDVITLAGGKAKNAYTDNINLSKSVSHEMVIYVYTTKEIKDKEKVKAQTCVNETIYIDTCKEKESSVIVTEENKTPDSITPKEEVSNDEIASDSTTEVESNTEVKLISLNTATKEELMTLSGVGESKAENIISYREQNNGFKSIEELKNVSGIGDAIFEKIKSNITI